MINLRSEDHKKILKQLWRLRVGTTAGMFLIVLEVIAGVFLLPSFLLAKVEFSAAQNARRALEAEGMLAAGDEIKSAASNLEKITEAFVAGGQFPVLEAIATLTAKKPSGVSITRVAVEEAASETIEFSGVAKNRAALQLFIERLRASEGVKAVDSPVSNFVKSEGGTFKIRVAFKEAGV